jgi:hypothetical protein
MLTNPIILIWGNLAIYPFIDYYFDVRAIGFLWALRLSERWESKVFN